MKRLIIGITGEMASGKDTATQYLVEKYGAKRYRFSDALRNMLDELALPQTRANLTRLSSELRQAFGENVLAEAIRNKVVQDIDVPLIVIDGIRRSGDVDFFREFPDFILLYIDAPLELRYERLIKRRQNADDHSKTFEEFKREHELETEAPVPGLKAQAQHVIGNQGTLEDLQAAIDRIVSPLTGEGV